MKTIKTLTHTLTNTYKAVRLLSNPAVSAMLERELSSSETQKADEHRKTASLSTNNTFFHKYYVVQVTN